MGASLSALRPPGMGKFAPWRTPFAPGQSGAPYHVYQMPHVLRGHPDTVRKRRCEQLCLSCSYLSFPSLDRSQFSAQETLAFADRRSYDSATESSAGKCCTSCAWTPYKAKC